MSQVTKRALETSLKRILLTKSFEKVTIKDITDDCGVNRMTFYYHFKDIYDLVEWVCYEDAKTILAERRSYENWQERMLQIFQEVRKEKVFVDNVYRAVGKERIEDFLHPLVRDLLMQVLRDLEMDRKLPEEDETFIANYYTYAFTGILFDWIKHDMKEEPEKIIRQMSLVVAGTVEDAIRRFRDMVDG